MYLKVLVLQKAVIPRRQSGLDQLLDCRVYAGVFGRMQIVDITSELDTAIVVESDIGRKPLVRVGPVGVRDFVATERVSGPSSPPNGSFVLLDHFSLASPLLDRVGDSDHFVLKDFASAVDEWVHGGVD